MEEGNAGRRGGCQLLPVAFRFPQVSMNMRVGLQTGNASYFVVLFEIECR